MSKKPKIHELHTLTIEEKISIYNEFQNSNKTLIEVLAGRGYNWPNNYPSVLLNHVIHFLRQKENEGQVKIIINNYSRPESFKRLYIEAEPDLKEFIFKSKV